jgi:hypothetical protein
MYLIYPAISLFDGLFGLWCLTPFKKKLSYIVASVLFVDETGVPRENPQPVVSH